MLVVPAVGDEPFDDGWVAPLNHGLYPAVDERQSPKPAVGCPPFKGKDTVLERPDGEQPGSATMRPGAYDVIDPISREPVTVVWWDPLLLERQAGDTRGLRRDDLISKDARPEDVVADRARYDAWVAERRRVTDSAGEPSLSIVTATEWSKGEGPVVPAPEKRTTFDLAVVDVEDAGIAGRRPSGKRFGVLVHALLAVVPLDASLSEIRDLARLHARVLAAPDEERDEASMIVERVLRHPVLRDARQAEKTGRPCRREAPVSIVIDDVLVDGQVDLAFEGDQGWTVVDFKTDVELAGAEDLYRRQVALYTYAIAKITGRPARGLVLRV